MGLQEGCRRGMYECDLPSHKTQSTTPCEGGGPVSQSSEEELKVADLLALRSR